jgi:adenosylhomocysteinase
MNSELVEQGRQKIAWASTHMPLLNALKEEFEKSKPFAGKRLAMSIHLEAKTACLTLLLRAGGAEVFLTGSNPLSTQDEIVEALQGEEGLTVNARRGVSESEYVGCLRRSLEAEPDLFLEDGGDMIALMLDAYPALCTSILGGTEETTTGVSRLRAWESEGKLHFPVFAVNDAKMKSLIDNRYGTGQSVWDAILRTTNLLIAGKNVLIVGYGWCGRGIAMRACGLGARVSIAEVDPIKAVEAVMDGYTVTSLLEGIKHADLLITATGGRDILTEAVLQNVKDGLVIANASHFDHEIDRDALGRFAETQSIVRPNIRQFRSKEGKCVYLIGEGKIVNLSAGDGHPVEIMDISFALQALTLRYIVEHAPLDPGLHPVPRDVDEQVARLKLETMGVSLDTLTEAQRRYLGL